MISVKKNAAELTENPPQITYMARSADDSIKHYIGVFIKVDESVSFYCCRESKEIKDSVELRAENDRLKEKMRNLVTQFSDGIAAFEIPLKVW